MYLFQSEKQQVEKTSLKDFFDKSQNSLLKSLLLLYELI